MPERPTGTVTFLFTDIEGSTQLLRQLHDRYDEVLQTHARLIREAVERFDGHEIDTQGDAFFVVFARAVTRSQRRSICSARSRRRRGPRA